MNKSLLILATFAFFIAPMVLSSDLKESENRELISINLGNIIKALNGTIKYPALNSSNSTNSTNTTTPATPVTNNTSSNNTLTPPATNNTSSDNNTSTIPVTNTTQPVTNPDDSDAGSSNPDVPTTNGTSPTNSTNTTSPTNSTNTTNTTTPVTPVKYAKNDVNMKTFPEDCLKVHNQVRMDVGLNNLTWSESLAASAQTWAENMAKNGFRHSGKSGENIASSTYSTKTLSRLLGLWTKEKNYYIVGCKYPSCSSTSAEVGHYTQMVWHSTTQVGCGFAPGYNRGYNYLCCQYYKAGNIRGQYVYPVPTA